MSINILRNGLQSDLAAVKSFLKKADVLIKSQPDCAIRYKNIVAAFDIGRLTLIINLLYMAGHGMITGIFCQRLKPC